PSCTDLVDALRAAPELEAAKAAGRPLPTAAAIELPAEAPVEEPAAGPVLDLAAPSRPETAVPHTTAPPASVPVMDCGLLQTSARQTPPKVEGEGLLFPALVIGLGQKGLEVVQTLRSELTDKFSSVQALPHLRLLGIDTDPDALTN